MTSSVNSELVIRALLASIFFAAGLSKLKADNSDQMSMLRSMGITSPAINRSVRTFALLIELAVAVWLASGLYALMSLWGAVCLLAAFSAILIAALKAGYRGPCGCFGAGKQPIGGVDLMFNVTLICLAAYSLIRFDSSLPSRPMMDLSFGEVICLVLSLSGLFLARSMGIVVETFFRVSEEQ